MTSPILSVRGVERRFDTTLALQATDLDVAENDFVTILGPSGCGKSTLLRIVAGLDTPTGGEVLLDGQCITGPGADRGMVFQSYTLFPWLTVLDNVCFGLRERGVPRPQQLEAAHAFLQRGGLRGFEQHFPKQLSGGMQQRVAIARALVLQPPLVLADEPTGNLDTASSDEVFKLMRHMHATLNTAFLIVTHDPRLAARCDRVIELVDGRIQRDERQVPAGADNRTPRPAAAPP